MTVRFNAQICHLQLCSSKSGYIFYMVIPLIDHTYPGKQNTFVLAVFSPAFGGGKHSVGLIAVIP